MHIGLIGGIGPAATDFYYRRLISTFASKQAALDLTIVHADTPTLLGNLASNNAAAQVAIYMRLTKRLAAADAGCVVVTSIAGHFCIADFKSLSPLPVIDMISEVNRAIEQRGLRRIGILGTRTASWRAVSMEAWRMRRSSLQVVRTWMLSTRLTLRWRRPGL
jgi:aspartate racemase